MKNKTLIIGVLGACVLAFGAYVVTEFLYKSEYQRNLEKLQQTCSTLTGTDSMGRVYEAIVGRYLETKSRAADFISSSPVFLHRMTFVTSDGELIVSGSIHTQKYEKYFSDIAQILEKNSEDPARDTDIIYGICASKTDRGTYYMGQYNTLMKIGKTK